MSQYYFRVSHIDCCSSSETAFEVKDDCSAWKELTQVCGDLAKDVTLELKQDSNWNIELLDSTKKPLSRIRILAETLI